MKLEKFRVTSFRSVHDSGWVEAEGITSLIGTNESGKTNVLLPLWKLNPAEGGEINLQDDLPRESYHSLRNEKVKPIFITAFYSLSEEEIDGLVKLTTLSRDNFGTLEVSRDFDGKYYWNLPNATTEEPFKKEDIGQLISDYISAISKIDETAQAGQADQKCILESLEKAKTLLQSSESLNVLLKTLMDDILHVKTTLATATSTMKFIELKKELENKLKLSSWFPLNKNESIIAYLKEHMPKYVYYSNYGNLDSLIYLPQVIQNFNRTDLGVKEAAKVRTLKTLFRFVKLDPAEIHKLGAEPNPASSAEIEKFAVQKKEREILLASASSSFTKSFNEWWKQGDYRFEFQADGNFFRIWVSDGKRPEKIELEARSTGLQWFFSFYLVFLVESELHHRNAILLLDEPGVTLHPLSQKDLFEFFEGLAAKNQILYTTHSPFMVDSDHLERVRSVYIDKNGKTVVSSDLRESEKQFGDNQPKSIYPVHAALGLTVSDTLLLNCNPVLVEGESDQLYLSALKNLLIASGKITPHKEIVFIPTGGVKGIKVTTSILASTSGGKPYVIVDGDQPGQKMKAELLSGLYAGEKEKVLDITDFTVIPKGEIEDLFPHGKLAELVTKILDTPEDAEDEFVDTLQENIPICNQIEEYARKYSIPLEKGWKVKLAQQVKKDILRKTPKVITESDAEFEKIVALFSKFAE